MPVTNGELVESLVKRALVKHTKINKTGISGDQGDGHQPYGFAAKQLLNAEKGENVSPQKLEAIAKRLGELLGEDISTGDLVGAESSAKKKTPKGRKQKNKLTKKIVNKQEAKAYAKGSTAKNYGPNFS